MAAGSITIQTLETSPTITTLDLLRTTDGRKLIEFQVDAPLYDIKRFHPPGTDGNIVVRNGLASGKLIVMMRYISTSTATILDNYNTDVGLWENTAVKITGESDEVYSRCNLVSMQRTQAPRGAYMEGVQKVYMDAQIEFTRDA